MITRPSLRLRRGALAAALTIAVATVAAISPTVAARPTQSVSDGVRTLSVSQAQGLDPNGQAVVVSGSGYDVNKGIYLAYCLEPLPGQLATPCGGGVDRDGSTGSSAWISDNPPAYGVGLAIPYGAGGSFSYTINVSPMIGNIDCRRAQCVIATRNDHVRSSDRSQDMFIPISFAEPGGNDPGPNDPGGNDPEPVETTTTTTTIPRPLPDEERAAPEATLSVEDRTVTAGDLVLGASKLSDISPDGEVLIVNGSGFDEERGIGVSFCAIGDDGTTGPCISDERAAEISEDAVGTHWVSSNPSEGREGDVVAYGPDGSFAIGLGVAAEIDEDTDCREVDCAIVTIADPDRPSDAGQNLVLPVTFEVEEEPVATTTTEAPAATTTSIDTEGGPEEGGDGDSNLLLPIAIVLLLAAAVGGGLWYRSRNSGAAAGATGAEGATDAGSADEAAPESGDAS